MSLSERSEKEIEAQRDRAWRAKARGHPMRWRILRDMVAVLSLGWMTTSQVQIAMRRIYALKNNTTRDILEELEQEKTVVQEKEDKSGLFKWGSTSSGVSFWIGKTVNIPAGIVEVAYLSMNVNELEADKRIQGGPSP